MKLIPILTTLGLMAAGFAGATENASPTAATPQNLKMAKRFAQQLPQTLVVRRDRMGNIAIYHSQKMIPAGKQVGQQMQFSSQFNKKPPQRDTDLTSSQNYPFWNFWWNIYNPYAYPTYYYSNPYYGYNYSYNYYPYYSYYGPFGYNYRYYRWRW